MSLSTSASRSRSVRPASDAALAGETVGRHPLMPRRLTNARDALGCRVLFIGSDDSDVKQKALAALDRAGAHRQ